MPKRSSLHTIVPLLSPRILTVAIRILMGACVCVCLQLGVASIRGQTTAESTKDAAPKKDVLWIIPHSHWEGAVFKTREEYLDVGLANILKCNDSELRRFEKAG